jgi:hypothetical protein
VYLSLNQLIDLNKIPITSNIVESVQSVEIKHGCNSKFNVTKDIGKIDVLKSQFQHTQQIYGTDSFVSHSK